MKNPSDAFLDQFNAATAQNVESPAALLRMIDAERAAIDGLDARLDELTGADFFVPDPAETPAEAEARRQAEAAQAPSGPSLTGVRTDTLFGTWDEIGWPIAFEAPLEEPAHDLVASGAAWGVGYMKEVDGFWRPVCPFSPHIPPDPPKPPPPEGGGDSVPPTRPRSDPKPPCPDDPEIPAEPTGEDGLVVLPPREIDPWKPLDGTLASRAPSEVQPPPDEEGCCAQAALIEDARIRRVVRPAEPCPPPAVPGTPPFIGLNQGRTVIQPVRPKAMRHPNERLGGGPWRPDVPLVDRAQGVRVLDADDFNTQMTLWNAIETLSNRLNQAISLINEMRPHGRNALDDAGVLLPVQLRDEPSIPGARDGTVGVIADAEEEKVARPFVRDRGTWRRWSFDHNISRVLGDGEGSGTDEVAVAFGDARARKLPVAKRARIGFDRAAKELFADKAPLHARANLRVSASDGPKASIEADALTDNRTQALPDRAGTVVVAESEDSSGNVVFANDVEVPGALTHNTAVVRAYSAGATDACSATSETAIYTTTIPVEALTQGTIIHVHLFLKKTDGGAPADSHFYLYFSGDMIAPSGLDDAYTGYDVVHFSLALLTDGATADVYCHEELIHNDTPHPHADDAAFTANVDLSADTDLVLKVINGSGTDSVTGLGWHVEVRSPA